MESLGTDNTIWYVVGVLFLIYFIILVRNKRGNKKRRSRQFMEGKRRHKKDH